MVMQCIIILDQESADNSEALSVTSNEELERILDSVSQGCVIKEIQDNDFIYTQVTQEEDRDTILEIIKLSTYGSMGGIVHTSR